MYAEIQILTRIRLCFCQLLKCRVLYISVPWAKNLFIWQLTAVNYTFIPLSTSNIEIPRSLCRSYMAHIGKPLISHTRWPSTFQCTWSLQYCSWTSDQSLSLVPQWGLNPILTGGVKKTPLHEIRDCLATAADRDTPFYDISWLKSYESDFDTKFAKFGPSVARSCDVLYSHFGTKFAQNPHFAYVCVQNRMEITDCIINALKQCLFCL